MKIIQAHNYYQNTGGEATVVSSERALLEENGHTVIPYERNNQEIENYSLFKKVGLIKNTSWSKQSYAEVKSLLKKHKPDVCHVHNFLPLISPSIYKACKDQKVPVVQTLHNYRLICTNGLLLRENKVCERCLGKSPYTSIKTKCYRDSYLQTYTVARMLQHNTQKGTWNKLVDAYLCLTQLAKDKFVEHGLPEQKLFLKPNFVEVPEVHTAEKEDYLIFVGRLEEAKGVKILKEISDKVTLPIFVVGDGELKEQLKGTPNLKLLGKKTHMETLSLIKAAKALIFPSIWYEGMPMTILESFASRTAVFASNMGAMQSMIEDRKNGFLFEPNSAKDLAEKLNTYIDNKAVIQDIEENAFQQFQQRYSRKANYNLLTDIYKSVIQNYR